MIANMYVSTSAVNGWQFNPAKWDWRNVKTWSSLVHSGISGYRMGYSIEEKIKNYYKDSKFYSQKDAGATYNEKYRNPGNHDSEIIGLEDRYGNNYKEYINRTYTDGTSPPSFKYLEDYGVYEYTGKSNKYIKTGDRAGGMTVPLGNNKYDVYISPYNCDVSLKITYQHEMGHVALNVSKLRNVFYQESALYFRMYEITGNRSYWNSYWHYGHTYPLRYYDIIKLIIRP